ncbi:P4/MP [Mallotus japonicus virus A]|uniref:P4/MP n=1 Tax=Mallotus japonicus virus A TaxID=2977935 RepID=A0AAE9NTU1_9VIRU|nr:P4/MP [Mallotus japonicus virus A]
MGTRGSKGGDGAIVAVGREEQQLEEGQLIRSGFRKGLSNLLSLPPNPAEGEEEIEDAVEEVTWSPQDPLGEGRLNRSVLLYQTSRVIPKGKSTSVPVYLKAQLSRVEYSSPTSSTKYQESSFHLSPKPHQRLRGQLPLSWTQDVLNRRSALSYGDSQ